MTDHAANSSSRRTPGLIGAFIAARAGVLVELRTPTHYSATDERFAPTVPEVVRALLADYLDTYDHAADRDAWFAGVRAAAGRHGFAQTTGDYKRNPEAFTGSIGEASNVLRIALTGARQSPDLYVVCQAIGEDAVRARIAALLG